MTPVVHDSLMDTHLKKIAVLEKVAERLEARAQRVDSKVRRWQLILPAPVALLVGGLVAWMTGDLALASGWGAGFFVAVFLFCSFLYESRDSIYEAARAAEARELPHKRALVEQTVGGELLTELLPVAWERRKLPFRMADGVHEVYVRQLHDGSVEFDELVSS